MAHIRDLLAATPLLSFEFFPPKTDEAQRSLEKVVHELASLSPAFVSVTYGAGGTEVDRTRDLVVDLTRTHPFPTMAHLTCMGHRRAQLEALVDDYAAQQVHNILALGGDPPADGRVVEGDFDYASQLVDLIRGRGDFTVGVAAFPELHPRSETTKADREQLARKLEGADFGVTQFFFDPAPYFRMVEDLDRLGCSTPVVAGVMPVTNPVSIRRFAAMNGTRIPPGLWARLEALSPEGQLELAVEHASELASELLAGGAPGIHLYTLNRAEAARQVATNVGLG